MLNHLRSASHAPSSQTHTSSVPAPISQLCSICAAFDIGALYEAAAERVRTSKPTPSTTGGFTTYEGYPFFYRHHHDLASVAAGAQVGCRLCAAIWTESAKVLPRDLNSGQPTIPQGEFTEPVYLGLTSWSPEAQGMPYLAAVQRLPRDTVRGLATFDVFTQYKIASPGVAALLARPVATDPASQESLDLVRQWHDECLKHHPKCASLFSKPRPLPTRVIDVGDAHNNPRLIATNGKAGAWAALSYCWGGNSPFILTGQTSQGFFGGQTPLANWPTTLRDAITITRALHIQYLWIDALCILQDSPTDWAAEAARMKDVYGGALITVCATSSVSTGAGIFRPRSVPSTLCELPLRSPSGSTSVSLRSSSSFSDTTQKNEALNTRGWTLQESLLSPRTLSYGSQQLIWECPSLKIAENGRPVLAGETYRDKAFVQSIMADNANVFEKTALKLTKLSLGVMPINRSLVPSSWEGKADQGYCRWFAIVKDFSARNLTVMADILPALAGVANAFEHLLQDEYVAGLWKRDLVRGMCWSRGNLPKRDWKAIKAVQSGMRNDGMIPSWSWASVIGGRVLNTLEEEQTWPFIAVRETAKIIEARPVPLHGDIFGKLKNISIILRGPVRDVPDFKSPMSTSRDPVLWERIGKEFVIQTSQDEYDQQHQSHPGQTFCVLRLMMTDRLFQNQFTGKEVNLPGAGLLMLESTGSTDEFRRVGFMSVSVPADPDKGDLNVRLLDEMKAAKWEQRQMKLI